ncbi:unnamed protein product [Brachionus calyciflorus]|uniref:Uncharacterized protein n=1 Tax=Brachionus calyciflorus TaxID=104777 RepID=A0A813WDH2_9BILA|nr:unnamed protein product [Brachionus calyciflorus]
MNRSTFTAYLPESKIMLKQKSSDNSLEDYTRLLKKQTEKLESLDQQCLANLDKCNRCYLSAQNRETRLNNRLKQTKSALRSQSLVPKNSEYNIKTKKLPKYPVFKQAFKLNDKY